ncbi:MAG: phage minor head protein [Pseudomonadales bacterium]|nr:phage minor head protein [Pseudomonadales bacterium]
MTYLLGRRGPQEVAVQDRLRAAYELSATRTLEREFQRALDEVAVAVEVGGSVGLAMEAHARRLAGIYQETYRVVGEVFGDRVITAAGKSRAGSLMRKDVRTDFEDAINRILAAIGGRSVLVAETTREQIRGVLSAGEAEGLSQEALARQIREGAPDLPGTGFWSPRVRSLVIARTEVHTASVLASNAAAQATGLVTAREWASAEDSRTRPDHSAADGQTTTDTYTVGGVSMRFPGDPNAPADQIVNCRCVELYRTD